MSGLLTKAYWSASTFFKASAERKLPYHPLDRILAQQDCSVRAIATHAWATVPHYRDAMLELGIRPDDLRTAGDLAELPLIDGQDLADHPDRFYSRKYTDADTLTLHSSGTSGRPKAVRYDSAALFTALAHGHRQRAVMANFIDRRSGYREMSAIRPEAVSRHLRRFYEMNSWVPRPLDLQRSILPLDLPFGEAVDRINDFQPAVLAGYGSQLGALLRWAWEQGCELHRPQLIWYGADVMPDADRELIENGLGVPVISTYQADEALRIGFQCERRRGFHLSIDDVAVRVIKTDGSTAAPGEKGEIVISNLRNRATVLLNYRLGDMVTMPLAPCTCGRTLPTIDRIVGRADDLVLLADGQSRHALLLLAPLQAVPGVVQLQLVQQTVRQLSISAVCAAGSDWGPIRRALIETARSLLGGDMRIEAIRVKAIPREPSGKVRAVISHCRPGHVV